MSTKEQAIIKCDITVPFYSSNKQREDNKIKRYILKFVKAVLRQKLCFIPLDEDTCSCMAKIHVKLKKSVKKARKTKPYCHHSWIFESHNDFRDGEYYTCSKCGKVKFP